MLVNGVYQYIIGVLPDVINVLNEMQRYDDFVTVTKCIRERILTENIAFHLLLDIDNFYSKDSINAVQNHPNFHRHCLLVQLQVSCHQ
jgi:hypothetical protein